MSVISYFRGHAIFFKGGEWFYADTETTTVGSERPGGHCGSANTKEGHDGCLGTLAGVMNACCGHGVIEEAYVQFSPERCLRGEDAINKINGLRNPVQRGAQNMNTPFHIMLLEMHRHNQGFINSLEYYGWFDA